MIMSSFEINAKAVWDGLQEGVVSFADFLELMKPRFNPKLEWVYVELPPLAVDNKNFCDKCGSIPCSCGNVGH
jgi:hypothetical protein